MRKQIRERLQGKDWEFYKDKLVMVCCSKNTKGHVKGIYKDLHTGFYYSHWLNDKEIDLLFKRIMTNKKYYNKFIDLIK